MAIQMRRGLYANLDRSKLVAGEVVVALDKDNNNRDFIGLAKGPSNVVQLATQDDVRNASTPRVSGETLIMGGY